MRMSLTGAARRGDEVLSELSMLLRAPADAQRWFEHWLGERERWYTELGIRPDHLRLRAHDADELSHYSSGTSDVEYLFPIGWQELEGVANRGDFDLQSHAKHSGQKLEYFDQATGSRYVPHVIEPAAGADRATLAFLVDAYDEETVEREGLYGAATPQAFRADVLRRAMAAGGEATDEAALCERLGIPVAIVPVSRFTFKITTPEDLELAEAILARRGR